MIREQGKFRDESIARWRWTRGYVDMEGLERTVDWERVNPPKEIDPKQFDYVAEDAVLAQIRNHRL